MRFIATILVNFEYKKFRHFAIMVGQITNAFQSPKRILSITSRRIEIRAPSFLSFSRDIFWLRSSSSSSFFLLHPLSREKPSSWRAAAEIEQFERAASCWCHRKNIMRDWKGIFEFSKFFLEDHRSIRSR